MYDEFGRLGGQGGNSDLITMVLQKRGHMQRKDFRDKNDSSPIVPAPRKRMSTSSQVVTAESVQAEEVPTIPLSSLQTLSTLSPEVSVHSVASTRSISLPASLVVQPTEYQQSVGEWLQMWWDGVRPSYLLLSIVPVLVGSVLGWMPTVTAKMPFGTFHVLTFFALLAAVLFLQVGAHLINDYYDYLRGVDTSNALGPGGLIQQGLIRPIRVLITGLVFLCGGVLLGLVAASKGGLPVFGFVLLGFLGAYFYSATRWALSSIGLGELLIFGIFGPCITLSAYLVQTQTNSIDRVTLLYSVVLGLLATAVIHVNNMRDAEGDMQARKYTLAALLPLFLSRILYLLLVLGAYAIIVALGIPRGAPHLILLTLWTLPMLVVVLTGILRTDMPGGLHLVMRETLKLARSFTFFLLVALIVTAVLPVIPHIPSFLLPR